VRRLLARRAPRLRLRGFDTLRLFAERRRLRLTEREVDAALRLTLTLAEDDGARGVLARRARRFTLPLRFLDEDRLDAALRRRRDLRRGTGDGETAGAGDLGTVERRLRERRRRVDRELRLRLEERARELRDRERDDGAVGLMMNFFLSRLPAFRLLLSVMLRRIPPLRALGAFGVELRRRLEERLRDRFAFLTLLARGVGDCDASRFMLALRFARNSSFAFM